MGYTAAEGLILTGQGSTSDVTIKNDADATVLSIPTGTANVGIGTTAVPHGGVGAAKLAIEGTNASTAGPHVQFTTASTDYPLLQIFPWAHDNIHLTFDGYFDGSNNKSSSSTGTVRIQKTGADLDFLTGAASAGSNVTLTSRMMITDDGTVGIGVDGTATNRKLHVNGAISFGMGNSSATNSGNKLFGFNGSLVADNTARTLLQSISGGLGAGYFVSGMARDSATGFVDIIVTSAGGLGVVSSTTTKGSPGARSYTVSAENIKLAINDSSCTYLISISGLGTNDLGSGTTPSIGA